MKIPVVLMFLVTLAVSSLAQSNTILVKHELGVVELKAPAKRVVVLEYSFVDALAALNVKPIGGAIAPQGGDRGVPPYLKNFTQGVVFTGSRGQPSLEAILALKPDLILADLTRHKAIFENLNNIAPTVLWNSLNGDYNEILRQQLELGRIVGKEARAREVLANQAQLLQTTRSLTKRSTQPLLSAVAWAQGFTVQTTGVFTGEIFERLGRGNLGKPQGTQVRYELSLEGLTTLNPPVLVVFKAPDEKVQLEDWVKNPLWNGLAAVKNNRVYVFDRDLWSRGRGVLAVREMFKQFLDSGLAFNQAPKVGYQLR
jgi:ferric citrate transport system substrate-binding protein